MLETFTILTQPPNALVGAYHDRMPVMLEPADGAAWLDRSDLTVADFVDQLLVEPADI
jgi:putative SOS response-associated peptidase YedK